MADTAPIVKNVGKLDGSVQSVAWLLTTSTLTGSPVSAIEFAERTVQISGTFGALATLTMQGSNDDDPPSTWFPLTDKSNTAIAATSAGGNIGKSITETTRWIRPILSGGDGTTTLRVALIAYRRTPMRT